MGLGVSGFESRRCISVALRISVVSHYPRDAEQAYASFQLMQPRQFNTSQ